jgi:hypothetical protein
MILTVGATLACGTGACAVVVAAVLEGRAERVCPFYCLYFALSISSLLYLISLSVVGHILLGYRNV